MATPPRRDMPTYRDLIYPTLRAVASLGGSAQGSEITDALTELLGTTPEQLSASGTRRTSTCCRTCGPAGRCAAGAPRFPPRGRTARSPCPERVRFLPR